MRVTAGRVAAATACLVVVSACGPIVDHRGPRPVGVDRPREPERGVTRGELAAALADALNLPETATDHFGDDDASPHEDGINRAMAAGFATGCTETQFCPNQVVSRGVMAEFLARGLALPETEEDHFSDDDGSRFEPFVNRIAEAGLVEGHRQGGFGPMEPLYERHMLSFLSRARRLAQP